MSDRPGDIGIRRLAALGVVTAGRRPLPEVGLGWRALKAAAGVLFAAGLLTPVTCAYLLDALAAQAKPQIFSLSLGAVLAAGPVWLAGYIGGRLQLSYRLRRVHRRDSREIRSAWVILGPIVGQRGH